MRIAILEDDTDQADLLEAWLGDAGHQCTIFNDGGTFIRSYGKDSFDLLIFDWMVPELSGIEVLQRLRANYDEVVPVLFITQRDSEMDVVTALESGADDYMSKPVSPGETLARVNALARRVGLGKDDVELYEFPPYEINTMLRQVIYNGEPVKMTSKEYELTLFLFKNIGRIVSRGHLLEAVWGTASSVNTRTVDTHISRLRSKLGLTDSEDWRLTSVYQHGYRMEKIS